MESSLDEAFVRLDAALEKLVAPGARPAPRRHVRIRVTKWLEKLRAAPCANAQWQRSRNDHAALLLKHAAAVVKMEQDSSALPPPFNRNPTPGPLGSLPSYSTLCLRPRKNGDAHARSDRQGRTEYKSDKRNRDALQGPPASPPSMSRSAMRKYTNSLKQHRRNGENHHQPPDGSGQKRQHGASHAQGVPAGQASAGMHSAANNHRRSRALPRGSASAPPTPLRGHGLSYGAHRGRGRKKAPPQSDRYRSPKRRHSRGNRGQKTDFSEMKLEEQDSALCAEDNALENIYHRHQHHHQNPVESDDLQHDVVNVVVAEDGRMSFAGADSITGTGVTEPSTRKGVEKRASDVLFRMSRLSRAELETKLLELEAVVKRQRFEIEQLRSEVRIQKGMRTRGEQRQNDLHRLELERLAKSTESEIQIAMMEVSQHPAEKLLEQRLMEVADFQKKKASGGMGGGGGETGRKNRREIAKLKREVLAMGQAAGQIEMDITADSHADADALPSPPSARRRKPFTMPPDEAVIHRDPPVDDDAFLEYIEGFQRKTNALAEGLR